MNEAIEALPSLADQLKALQLGAKRSLGQNFLFDLNLTRKIARSAAPVGQGTVIEVGPGPGGLTRALLLEGAQHVIAVERDDRFSPILADLSNAAHGRLDVIFADAQTVKMADLSESPTQIVANLPYNVGSALLLGWLMSEPWPPWFNCLTLMFQKEVALRIVAKPGDKNYGRLSVLAGWRCDAQRLFDVPATAFVPPPKVTSAVVQLIPRSKPLPCDPKMLERVTAAAFGQRRKMVRQSLKALPLSAVTLSELMDRVGLKGTERAENLNVETYVALANGLAASTG
ncbi:MAG: 16S rRNA (adenine(1518)-N(6)/adenine(1519)-N(6))-dimethyltransferase RsmA [Pseudomonadota bacterium]